MADKVKFNFNVFCINGIILKRTMIVQDEHAATSICIIKSISVNLHVCSFMGNSFLMALNKIIKFLPCCKNICNIIKELFIWSTVAIRRCPNRHILQQLLSIFFNSQTKSSLNLSTPLSMIVY